MPSQEPGRNEKDLEKAIAECFADPLAYVYFVFPWGEPNTSLADEDGPDLWQTQVLEQLGEGSLTPEEALQIAVSSGHGVGKSALVSWIVHWFISTRAHPQISVTANTKQQLETKTWRELAKWNKLALNGHWFSWTATKFYLKEHPETWFAAAIPWSKEKSEAFAGTHEENVLIIFDEASLIDDSIWEVAEGAMTTPGAIWAVFGNPTRNTGRFRECFHKYRHRWTRFKIDSREAKKADNQWAEKAIEDYGEDSDFVRVRVKGEFPRAASNQLIPEDIVDAACGRKLGDHQYSFAPVVFGVDVARYGDDASTVFKRQGLASWRLGKFRNVNTMYLADKVSTFIHEHRPDTVFIDVGAMGPGVIDRLRQLGHDDVVEVNFGAAPTDPRYKDKRTEMWVNLKEWIKGGAHIPDDQDLKDDLIAPEYFYTPAGQMALERKEDMKKRGLASPDDGDGLALTHAYAVVRRDEPRPEMADMDGGALY